MHYYVNRFRKLDRGEVHCCPAGTDSWRHLRRVTQQLAKSNTTREAVCQQTTRSAIIERVLRLIKSGKVVDAFHKYPDRRTRQVSFDMRSGRTGVITSRNQVVQRFITYSVERLVCRLMNCLRKSNSRLQRRRCPNCRTRILWQTRSRQDHKFYTYWRWETYIAGPQWAAKRRRRCLDYIAFDQDVAIIVVSVVIDLLMYG